MENFARRVHPLGVRLFAAVCGFVAVASWGVVALALGLIGNPSDTHGPSTFVLTVIGTGAFVASVFGFCYGRLALVSRSKAPIAFVFALSTILTTVVILSWIAIVAGPLPYTDNVVLLTLLVLIYYGIPLLLLGIPTGLVWAAVVRRRYSAPTESASR